MTVICNNTSELSQKGEEMEKKENELADVWLLDVLREVCKRSTKKPPSLRGLHVNITPSFFFLPNAHVMTSATQRHHA